jgi:hypothetical protein
MISSAVCWSLWKVQNSCFQDVARLGMKQVWQRVIPMLKCYRILVLVRSLDGFDAALATLDKLMVHPERIAFETSLGVIDLNVGRRKVLDMCGAHFDPP